ncbi:hypothetical protein LNQ49_01115 [Flavobacterium sp. F-65]|uniref:Uncharacterized protein n=1 Tax=Flavobacterium pisciphilum TaxID=2893755 RepID=A0ABS8MN52_9FLAO|nr:hypothetical protein [Flavobacterium sp. F-65]MCC9070204.1 hypothetical protein [Flavobacterium sp. F-65]
MRKVKLAGAIMIAALAISSCKNDSKETKLDKDSTSIESTEAITSAEIITDTVTNSEGIQLITNFDNEKGTLTIDLSGEKIEMVQDTTASGVKAHNDKYEYTNWHGETQLKKDGKVIFFTKDKE